MLIPTKTIWRCLAHGSPQLSGQKLGINIDFSGNACGGDFCLMEGIPITYMKNPQGGTKLLTYRNTACLDQQGQTEDEMNKLKEDC